MKKTLLVLLSLVASLTVQAQTVDFKNLDATLNQPVFDVNGTTPLSGFTIELLAGPAGGTLTSFATTTVNAGYFFGGVVQLSGLSAGAVADIIIRAYNGASFDSSLIRGTSAKFSVITGGAGSPASSPAVFNDANDPNGPGFQSFSVAAVPEPTTIALGVLGGIGMLVRRRRNA
jgi:hypothetical protein